MKFVYRTIVLCIFLVLLLVYFYHIRGEAQPEHVLPFISDRFGETCLHNDKNYKEGELFTEPCKQCYCSFGVVECAVVHCQENGNHLGMNMIKKSIQVIIPTGPDQYAGTISLMNSVLRHTKHRVKFVLVHPTKAKIEKFPRKDQWKDDFSASHLIKWIESTELRTADYLIVQHPHNWISRIRPLANKKDKVPAEVADIQNSTEFSKLMLNTIVPLEHRAVVLSSNVIIRGDIAELYNLDLKNNSVGVINDCKSLRTLHSPQFSSYFTSEFFERNKFPETDCTFSTSIMVVDLDLWFEDYTEHRLLLLFGHLLYSQKAFVKMKIDKHSYILPLLLNFRTKFFDIQEVWGVCNIVNLKPISSAVVENSKIINWIGDRVPWSNWTQLQHIWDEYYLPDPTGLFRLDRGVKPEGVYLA